MWVGVQANNTIKEEIVVIGGGLGGCLTALMLAKNPQYHVTLVEAQDTLLNGASTIAARLHLGGEYPLHPKTSRDCLNGAAVWKLLMPDSIYTPVPPMKFLVARNTELVGELTVDKYLKSYEKIRQQYVKMCKKVAGKIHASTPDAANKGLDAAYDTLFGPADKGKFFRQLTPEEYSHYHQGDTWIAGGFQSPELGLNIPKYLTMIQKAIDEQVAAGNITVKMGCKVKPQGISGKLGEFKVECMDGSIIEGSQVVQAAWQGGPEIMPPIVENKKKPADIHAFKRAMMLVELPEGFKTPPAFIMLGEDGGMLAPFNDKMALCYIPTAEAAYCKHEVLTSSNPSLSDDYHHLTDTESRLRLYLAAAKRRFPVLKDVELDKARLVFRDTLSFDDKLSARTNKFVKEATTADLHLMGGMGLLPLQSLQLIQQLATKVNSFRPINEVQCGLFTLYPTKATYSLLGALQAYNLILQRSEQKEQGAVQLPPDMLDYLLQENHLAGLSLKNIAEPTKEDYDRFFEQHPDLADPERKMLSTGWPADWASKAAVSKRTGWSYGIG